MFNNPPYGIEGCHNGFRFDERLVHAEMLVAGQLAPLCQHLDPFEEHSGEPFVE